MFRKIAMFCLLFIGMGALHAANLGILPNVLAKPLISVDRDNIYVTHQQEIWVFSLANLKPVRQLSRKGAGPGEFWGNAQTKPDRDEILAFMITKYIRFKKTGEIVVEKMTPFFILNMGIAGDNYILYRTDISGTRELNYWEVIEIVNKDLKRVKVISKKDVNFKRSGAKKIAYLISPLFRFECSNDRIYVVDGDKGFYIEVYNKNGDRVGVIEKEYDKIKVTEAERKRIMQEHLDLPQVKKRWHILKNMFDYRFPDYYPAIKDFYVADGKMYVSTYLEKDGKEEYWVLSGRGDVLKHTFLPQCNRGLFAIGNNFFYYLVENDEEGWELHAEKIE